MKKNQFPAPLLKKIKRIKPATPKDAKKLQVIKLLAEGKLTQKEIVEKTGASPASLLRYRRKLLEEGAAKFLVPKPKQRVAWVETDKSEFKQLVKECKFNSLEEVSAWVETRTGKVLNPDGASSLIYHHGGKIGKIHTGSLLKGRQFSPELAEEIRKAKATKPEDQKRLLVAKLLLEGKLSQEKIGKAAGVVLFTVGRYQKILQTSGVKGLFALGKKARKNRVNFEEVMPEFLKKLKQGGFKSRETAHTWLTEKLGETPSIGGVYSLARRLGKGGFVARASKKS